MLKSLFSVEGANHANIVSREGYYQREMLRILPACMEVLSLVQLNISWLFYECRCKHARARNCVSKYSAKFLSLSAVAGPCQSFLVLFKRESNGLLHPRQVSSFPSY